MTDAALQSIAAAYGTPTFVFDADALRDVYGVTGSIVDVQGHKLVLIDDEEKETRS